MRIFYTCFVIALTLLESLNTQAQYFVGWDRLDVGPAFGNDVEVDGQQNLYTIWGGDLYQKGKNDADFSIVTTNGIPANANPIYLYINPKEANGNMYMVLEGGTMYRSANAGANWTAIASSPDNASFFVFYKIPGGALILSTRQGLYYSNDLGQNWQQWTTGDRVTQITQDTDGNLVFGTRGHGIKQATTVGGTLTDIGLADHFVQRLGVSPGNWIFAISSLDSTSAFPYIYRSHDRINYTQHYPYDPNAPFRPTEIAFGKNEGIYVGSNGYGMLRSDNNGTSWYQTITGITNEYKIMESLVQDHAGFIHVFAEFTSLKTTLWSSRWSAFQPSTFEQINTTVAGVNELMRLQDGRMMARTNSVNGDALMFSSDDGFNWTAASQSFTVQPTGFTQFADGRIVVVNFKDEIHKSTDDGASFQTEYLFNVNMNLSDVTSRGSVGLASGEASVYTSYDNGATWTEHFRHIGQFSTYAVCHITGNGTFLVAENYTTSGGFLHRSTDSANTWTQIPADPGVGPRFADFAEAADGTIWAAADSGVYFSTDDGVSWTKDVSHPDLASNAIEVRANGDIESAMPDYVFRKRKDSLVWDYHSIPEVLGSQYLFDDAVTGKLYAGTVFRTVQPEPALITNIEEVDNIQPVLPEAGINLYPNPVSDQLNVAIDHITGNFSLQVFDLQGHLFYSKDFNGIKGQNMVELATGQWPNGMYVIVILDGTGLVSNKFLKQ